MKHNIRTISALLGLTLASLTACDAEENTIDDRSAILPLIAYDSEHDALGLVGTFDSETQELWLTHEVTQEAVDLAMLEGAEQTQIRVMRQDGRAQTLSAASTMIAAGLDVDGLLRTCVFDPTGDQLWTITDVRVGTPDELDDLAIFVPSSLSWEDGVAESPPRRPKGDVD